MSARSSSNRTTSRGWALLLTRFARAAIRITSSLISSIATSITDVRVIDVAIDDISDDVIRMAARANLVSSSAHPRDVVRFEELRALIRGHPLSGEHPV